MSRDQILDAVRAGTERGDFCCDCCCACGARDGVGRTHTTAGVASLCWPCVVEVVSGGDDTAVISIGFDYAASALKEP